MFYLSQNRQDVVTKYTGKYQPTDFPSLCVFVLGKLKHKDEKKPTKNLYKGH